MGRLGITMLRFSLPLCLLLGAAPALAHPSGVVRSAAERLADWAASTGDSAVLSGSVSAMVAHGAMAEPDDPWIGRHLAALPDWYADTLTRAARGVMMGCEQCWFVLQPGEIVSLPILFAEGERADAEVRLHRGSGTADIDLFVLAEGAELIAQDATEETGRPGIASYVQWTQADCAELTIQIVNRGPEAARAVFLASSSERTECGGDVPTFRNDAFGPRSNRGADLGGGGVIDTPSAAD